MPQLSYLMFHVVSQQCVLGCARLIKIQKAAYKTHGKWENCSAEYSQWKQLNQLLALIFTLYCSWHKYKVWWDHTDQRNTCPKAHCCLTRGVCTGVIHVYSCSSLPQLTIQRGDEHHYTVLYLHISPGHIEDNLKWPLWDKLALRKSCVV